MSGSVPAGTKTAVVLSSGFFGFYAHAGFMRAAGDCGISPCGYAGSSAGAVVAALAAAGYSGPRLRDCVLGLKKELFWDPEPWHATAAAALRGFRGWQGRLRGDALARTLAGLLPVSALEDLQVPCLITATDLTRRQGVVLSRGSIAAAVRASCCVPWLFRFAQVDGSLCIDGGLVDKAPVMALVEKVRPAVVLVHYLPSENLRQDTGKSFLNRMLSPGRAATLAVSIARHEHYLLQKRMAGQQGVRVVEIVSDAPRVGPGSLHRGPEAESVAYAATMAALSDKS